MKSRYLLFFLILIYIISPCTATGDYKFRTMSPSGGFYYDGIKAIEQDKEGFIWTMMDYELYRFDVGIITKNIIPILPRWRLQKGGYSIIWHPIY